jgi:hypothetical protein
MTRLQTKRAMLLVSAVLLTGFGVVFAYRVCSRTRDKTLPKPAPGASSTDRRVDARRQIPSPGTAHVLPATEQMSHAFDSGDLPSPATVPPGDRDAAVVTLAKQIAARDGNSTAALITAIQSSGFAIRQDGSLLPPSNEASQGMAFDAWQVAAMAKLYDEDWHITVNDLSVILQKCFPEFNTVQLGDALLQGITNATQKKQPLRFWSRLVVELGRNASQPYDLSTDKVNPGALPLDSIQVALILQRLAGDLKGREKTAPARLKASANREYSFSNPQWEDAVFHPDHSEARLILAEGSRSDGCSISESDSFTLDIQAMMSTTEWQNLVDIEKQAEEQAEPLTVQQKANVVLTLLRFYLIYAGLHADVTRHLTSCPHERFRSRGYGGAYRPCVV